ncbi:hypothetical protein CHS0354_009586 [Potamilus streckersoni]|uniref:Uncharacterized protein n=1 Tax=Potamilus streckersoni TaxID=2493646 RepID=A0AAE0W0B2_9BIVA|nr:hypothetical protein CHS0354_009586 [Potamilus streckersoni]
MSCGLADPLWASGQSIRSSATWKRKCSQNDTSPGQATTKLQALQNQTGNGKNTAQDYTEARVLEYTIGNRTG